MIGSEDGEAPGRGLLFVSRWFPFQLVCVIITVAARSGEEYGLDRIVYVTLFFYSVGCAEHLRGSGRLLLKRGEPIPEPPEWHKKCFGKLGIKIWGE